MAASLVVVASVRGSDLQLKHLLCSLGLLRGHLHPGGTALPQLLQFQLEAFLLLLINLQQKTEFTIQVFTVSSSSAELDLNVKNETKKVR